MKERARIQMIGDTAAAGHVVGVAMDRNDEAKIVRYIEWITRDFPTVRVIDRTDGGAALGVVIVRFGPKPNS